MHKRMVKKMADLLSLNIFSDQRGSLIVVDKELPFSIKRIYFIDKPSGERGGHRHHVNRQAMVCVRGSCEVYVNDGMRRQTFVLDRPDKCLILECKDWHVMKAFSPDALLAVCASEHYNVDDYIDEKYPND